MKKIINKLLSLMTVIPICTMLLSTPVLAANGTSQEKTGDGTADCTVNAVVESSYSVTLPATLTLTKQTDTQYTCEYTVGAKGNITQKQYVSIEPGSSFTLTGATNGQTSTASVSQAKTKWTGKAVVPEGEIAIGTDSYTTSTGTVSATLTQADNYSGKFTFTYSLVTNS